MIRTFGDKSTAAIFLGKPIKRLPPEIRKRAREKLDMINQARVLDDLRVPANRITSILSKDRRVTADTALRLARYFGTTPSSGLGYRISMTWKLRWPSRVGR